MAYDIGPKIGMDGEAEFRQQLREINTELKTLDTELKKVSSSFKSNAQSQDALIARNKTLQKSVDTEKRKIEEANKALEAAKENYGENSQEAMKWQQVINRSETALNEMEAEIRENDQALEEMRRGLRDAATGAKIMEDAVGSGNAKLGDFSKKAGELGNRMGAAGKKLMPVSAGFAAIGFAAGKSAVDFESAFAGVTKTVEGTDGQLAKIRQGILDLSKSTSSSASDIAAVAEAAGQLGIKTPDIMKFTETMVKLGDTTNLSAEEAASALAKFANITGTSAKDYDRLGSVIVDLGNNFATTESDIVEMSTRLASTGNLAGLSEPQIMALATAMSSVGIEAEAGGTAMSKLIKQMQVAVETGNGDLAKFASVAGMTGEQFKTAFEQDAVGALGAFISGLNDTERNGASATAVLDEMGLTEARLSNAVLSLASSGDLLTNTLDTANGAWKNNNALNKEAEKRYQTTATKLSQTKAAMVELGVSLGDTFLPAIKAGAEGLKKLSDKLSKAGPVTKGLVTGMIGIGMAAGPALSGIGKVSTGISALTGWMSKAENASKLAAISSSKLGTASKGLFNILKANPYAAVAAGAVAMGIAVGAAIYKVVQATHEERNAAKEAAKSREENIASIKSQGKEAEFYRQKLDELSGVENKSASQKQLMQAYVDRLNESVDGLNLTYDAEKDKLNQTTDAIKNKIKAQQEEAIATAYQKQAKAALEDYVKAQTKASEIHDELNAKKRKWNELSDSEKQVNGELAKEISNLKIQYKDAAGAADMYLQESVKISNANAKQSGAWKELLNQAGITGKQLAPTLVEGINSGKYVIPTTVEELNALISFDAAAQKATGDGQKLANNLATQIAAGEISVADATKKLTAANAAQLSSGAAAASGKGKQTGSNYASGMASKKQDSQTAGANLATAAQTGAGSVSLRGTGKNLGAGLGQGLRDSIAGVAREAANLAQAALDAAKKKSKVNSPSKRWEQDLGLMDGAGYERGLMKSIPKVEKAGMKLSDAAFPESVKDTLDIAMENIDKTAAVAQASFVAEFDYEKLAAMMPQGIMLEGRQMGRAMRAAGVKIT